MSALIEKLCLCVLFLLCFVAVFTKSENDRLLNYVSTSVLPDGEQEVRMRFGNVIVRETSITHEKKGVRQGLLLRQVASGPHFLQMIYKLNHEEMPKKHRRLTECEVINDWGTANKFRTQFEKELQRAGLNLQVPSNQHSHKSEDSLSSYFDTPDEDLVHQETDEVPIDLDPGMVNVTVRLLRDDELTDDMKQPFDIQMQQKQCRRLHRRMKQILKSTSQNSMHNGQSDHSNKRVRREAFRVGIMPGTLWCGDGSLAEKYESMGAHVGADRCCREHDGCPFVIDAMSSKYEMFNYRMHTISHCTCDESKSAGAFGGMDAGRVKRELGQAFRLPGTQWCGRGYSAKEKTHLGGFTGADKCCRYHDLQCPFYIEAFQDKFGLFNWRMYTINHCTCDERFRSCLKQTNTGSANFVGKIFFNVVQTKCFLLKPEKSCEKLSWWGKCLKYEYKMQAHLRDPIPY